MEFVRKQLSSCKKCSTFLFAITIVLLTIPEVTYAKTCKKINNCACKFDDGSGVVDISALGAKSGGPKFSYALPITQPSSIWEYAFNPCYKFTDEFCKNVVACQRATDQKSAYRLGTAESAEWSADGTTVTYKSTGDDMLERKSRLTLICDQSGTVDAPSFTVNGEDILTKQQYDFTLTSVCACPGGCKSSGGGGGGLSFGSILCILFVVFVLVYIIGGMVFMKVVRKAEGKEVFPNIEFWTDLPNLIKDGFLYIKNKLSGGGGGGGGGGGYEDI